MATIQPTVDEGSRLVGIGLRQRLHQEVVDERHEQFSIGGRGKANVPGHAGGRDHARTLIDPLAELEPSLESPRRAPRVGEGPRRRFGRRNAGRRRLERREVRGDLADGAIDVGVIDMRQDDVERWRHQRRREDPVRIRDDRKVWPRVEREAVGLVGDQVRRDPVQEVVLGLARRQERAGGHHEQRRGIEPPDHVDSTSTGIAAATSRTSARRAGR